MTPDTQRRVALMLATIAAVAALAGILGAIF